MGQFVLQCLHLFQPLEALCILLQQSDNVVLILSRSFYSPECLPNQRRAPASVLNVLLLVYVMAVNVPSWLGNTPHTRDSLLPRSIVSMLTSFPLNAGWRNVLSTALCINQQLPSCSYASGWLLSPVQWLDNSRYCPAVLWWGVVWICLLNTMRFLMSTRNVFCGECHMMMVQKSPALAG